MPVEPNFEGWETVSSHASLGMHVMDARGEIAWVNGAGLDLEPGRGACVGFTPAQRSGPA